MITVEPARPYNFWELCENRYRVQNMLMWQFNMPTELPDDAKLFSAYDDRLSGWDYEGFRNLVKQHTGDGVCAVAEWARRASQQEVLAFLSDVFKTPVQGGRIVRYTNVSTGFPLLRYDAYQLAESDLDSAR